jgi:phage-related protein
VQESNLAQASQLLLPQAQLLVALLAERVHPIQQILTFLIPAMVEVVEVVAALLAAVTEATEIKVVAVAVVVLVQMASPLALVEKVGMDMQFYTFINKDKLL